MKKTKALILCVVLCMSLLLGACGEQTSGETVANSTEANYQVTVVDGLGNPYSEGVIVQFMQGGQQVAMQVVDANGVAAKTLEKGDYTVELTFTSADANCYYDASDLTLSADKTELQITLAYLMGSETKTLGVDDQECAAYFVNEGTTYVTMTAGQRNYFLFAPTKAGTYEFSVAEETAQIGYYGAPHFVQTVSAADVVDNAFTVSVSADMIGEGSSGSTVIVIGVDAGENENCMLSVARIGEAEKTLADEPWTVYQTTAELSPYTLPAGAKLANFDLTADSYTLVLNEADGFYHLDSADGPLVLVLLGEANEYLDGYKTILEHTGVNKYFFDENGAFMKKENYTDCLLEYIACMDEDNGVYPLTEDLKYIIQQHGDHSGWYDADSSMYLFVDDNLTPIPGINEEISWLFMCCYIAE